MSGPVTLTLLVANSTRRVICSTCSDDGDDGGDGDDGDDDDGDDDDGDLLNQGLLQAAARRLALEHRPVLLLAHHQTDGEQV